MTQSEKRPFEPHSKTDQMLIVVGIASCIGLILFVFLKEIFGFTFGIF